MRKITVPLFLLAVCGLVSGSDSLLISGVPTWEQLWPYNRYCPVDTSAGGKKYRHNGHYPVGCGPVAVSEIMRYYQYPDSGRGAVSYTTSLNLTLGMNLDTCVFDWRHMPMKIDTTSPETEQRSIASLLFAVGVMLKTDYTSKVSTVNLEILTHEAVNNIRYGGNVGYYYRNLFPGSRWDSLLIDELSFKRPVLLSAESDSGAHFFVVDGYVRRKTQSYFHVNAGDGRPGAFCPIDSMYLATERYYKNHCALYPFAPASLPAPENLRYSIEGNFLFIQWNPVADTNIRGYHVYQWMMHNKTRTKRSCSISQTRIAIIDFRDSASVKRVFSDSADEIIFNVVAVNRDSTGSCMSKTLAITRNECFRTAAAASAFPPASGEIRFFTPTRDGIRLILPVRERSVPLEAALFRPDGARLISSAVSRRGSQRSFFIPFDWSEFSSSQLIVQIRMSDGRKMTRRIISSAYAKIGI